jgi:hypothetical protein
MGEIIDFRERRVTGLKSDLGAHAAEMRASQEAEAEFFGIDPEAFDSDGLDLERALEERRDESASALGLSNASDLRRLRLMFRDRWEMTAEQEIALRYFRIYVLGEAA